MGSDAPVLWHGQCIRKEPSAKIFPYPRQNNLCLNPAGARPALKRIQAIVLAYSERGLDNSGRERRRSRRANGSIHRRELEKTAPHQGTVGRRASKAIALTTDPQPRRFRRGFFV